MGRSLVMVCAVAVVLGGVGGPQPVFAQEAAPVDAGSVEAGVAAAAAPDDALDADGLDTLVAPVALYPDALLAQVLVAATYPLDVMKADRFLSDNEGLADKDRATAAEGEGWDESVAVLAGGFPDVIRRMAEDIDWTQELGDAMIAQTDDVFDAVQRMRVRAEAAGNLASNDAQTVESDGDAISIAPADPNVVYVPSYDPVAAYTAPATAVAPAATTTGTLLTAGAVAFGSAMLVDAIFDDDDDWDDYWRGPPVIHWDDDDFRPRPDVTINGDVNIDRDRREARVDRIGDRIDHNGGAWKPTPQQRAAARERAADRRAGGPAVRPAGGKAIDQATRDRVKARSNAGSVEKRLKDAGGPRPAAAAAHRPKGSALAPTGGRPKVERAAARGSESLKRDHVPAVNRDRAKAAAHAKSVSRPAKHKAAPPRAAAHKQSALQKHGGGSRAKAASARGHHHAGGGGRRHR